MSNPRPQQQQPTRRLSDRDPFIRAEYLPPQGAAFTIKYWGELDVRQPSGQARVMPVITFTNGKLFIVNVTNLRKLAALFHNDEAASLGQTVILKPATVNNKPTIIVDRLARATTTQESETTK